MRTTSNVQLHLPQVALSRLKLVASRASAELILEIPNRPPVRLIACSVPIKSEYKWSQATNAPRGPAIDHAGSRATGQSVGEPSWSG